MANRVPLISLILVACICHAAGQHCEVYKDVHDREVDVHKTKKQNGEVKQIKTVDIPKDFEGDQMEYCIESCCNQGMHQTSLHLNQILHLH